MKSVLKNSLKAICYVALFMGMQFVVSFIAMFVYGFWSGMQNAMSGVEVDANASAAQMMEDLLNMTNWLTFASGVVTILFLVIFFAVRRKKLFKEARIVPFGKEKVLPLIIFGIAMSFFVTFVLSVLPIPAEVMEAYNESSKSVTSGSLISRILAIVIMAPVLEEIIFRGLVLSRLKRTMNVGIAIFVSSFLFGLMHGQVLWIAYAAVSGIVLGVIAEKCKSTGASMVVHLAFNSVSIWGAGFEPEGVMLYVVGLAALAVMAGCGVFIFKRGQQDAVEEKRLEGAC